MEYYVKLRRAYENTWIAQLFPDNSVKKNYFCYHKNLILSNQLYVQWNVNKTDVYGVPKWERGWLIYTKVYLVKMHVYRV